MRKFSILLALVAGLFATPALADFTGKDASAATITFKNPGACTSVVCVPVMQIYDGTNVVTLTTAGAAGVSNTLTGVPVYSRNLVFNGTTWDRWLGDETNGGFVNVKTSVLPTGAATQTTLATLALESGGNLAALVTDFGAPGSAICANDTASCSLNQQMQRLAQRLTTINSTLNVPFQVGGSIGNTTFAATQATSSNLKAQVDPLTAASWGIGTSTQNSASVANGILNLGQFNTTPTTITSGNMSPLQMDNAGNLLVNIKAGASSGAVAQGSTTSGQTGGLTQAAVTTAAPSYTTAQTSPLSLDTNGSLRVNVTTATGLAQGSTTSGQTLSLIGGAVTTAAPTYTTAQTSPFSLDTTGALRVNVTAGGGTGGTSSTFGSAFPATGTSVGVTDGTNMVSLKQGTTTGSLLINGAGTAGSATGGVLTVQGAASMTKLLVTPDSVALPANQSVNVAQFGGVSTATGQVAVSTAPVTATNTALVTALRPDSPGIIATGGATTANSVPVAMNSQYPVNSVTTAPTAITGNSTGTTGAVVGTLAAAASVTTFICGFAVDAVGGTAAVGPITVAGLVGSSMVFQMFSSATGASRTMAFSPCIPASAVNTAITVTTTANGTATAVDVNSWGYRL